VGCNPQGIYRPRNARSADLYRLVEDNFDQLERVWNATKNTTVSGARSSVVEQYLDCGDLRCGFAAFGAHPVTRISCLPIVASAAKVCYFSHQQKTISCSLLNEAADWPDPLTSTGDKEAGPWLGGHRKMPLARSCRV
jgi:hypothetical protein